jgi:hypothetical protein
MFSNCRVSRKRNLAKRIQEVPPHLGPFAATKGAAAVEKMARQRREIIEALAQRRNLY